MRFQIFALATLCVLSACGTGGNSRMVRIVDGTQLHSLQTNQRLPSELLLEAGVIMSPDDSVLSNGIPIALDQPAPGANSITLQVRRAVDLTLVSPEGPRVIRTSALTVGEALETAGVGLHARDHLEPPADSVISGSLTVTHTPARDVAITSGGATVHIRSAAATVGDVLAEAGMPVLGLDYSIPAENEPVPADGALRLVNVVESVVFSQKPIAFDSQFLASAEVELDQQQILQPGQPGLSVSRVRIRYEDGQEISRQSESETVVRPPQSRIVGYGTQVVTRTTVVDGVSIQYWRAVQMFATSYSPCRSAADRCYPGTSSGLPVKQGVVAVLERWYVQMQGQPVYIPGYGHATIEDVGGGIPGRHWIDLGYSDADYVAWGDWVTVYFLTPVPQNIVYVLD